MNDKAKVEVSKEDVCNMLRMMNKYKDMELERMKNKAERYKATIKDLVSFIEELAIIKKEQEAEIKLLKQKIEDLTV